MSLVRCTCVYRPASLSERDEKQVTIVVEVADPFCPASPVHERFASVREKATS